MKFASSLAVLAAAGAQAHYTFPKAGTGGALTGEWEAVRVTENRYSHGPVTDVSSTELTCYQAAAQGAPQTLDVKAGDSVTFSVDSELGHPGPLQFYMAKVPSGQTAADFDGSGAVWFKIYHDGPSGLGTESITWPSSGKTEVSVTIPSCVEDGEYLLRVEHIALHSAASVGGAQFYIACAQISVSGGSGSLNTGSLVSLPGAYSPTDPGIQFELYWPVPTEYINPGPDPVSC
ncbi:glycoside hydrolase family 61 protein [Corynascus similis CBS 632.67]